MCVILSANPLLLTAATESPPPITDVAFALSATALQISNVPFAKLGISKQPIGPFQTIVFACAMALLYASMALIWFSI